MGKLFKLALEEAVVEEPSIVEGIPVDDAVQNAEELAKTDSEIQQDIAAIEELVEEKNKLEDQAVTNDELLSNPDAVVTATDVEVSEETRTEVQYSLGLSSGLSKIRLSQESVANDVRSNPRKYLAISNEDIRDTIKKIWDKIKAFFKKIIDKLGLAKKAETIKSKLSDAYFNTASKFFKSMKKEDKNKSVFDENGDINVSTEDYLQMKDFQTVVTKVPVLILGLIHGNVDDVKVLVDEKSAIEDIKVLEATAKAYSEIIKNNGFEDKSKTDTLFKGLATNIRSTHAADALWKKIYKYFDVSAVDNGIEPQVIDSVRKGNIDPITKDQILVLCKFGAGEQALRIAVFGRKNKDSNYSRIGTIEATVNMNKVFSDTNLLKSITLDKIEQLIGLCESTSSKSTLPQFYTDSITRVWKMHNDADNLNLKELTNKTVGDLAELLANIQVIAGFLIPGIARAPISNRAAIKNFISNIVKVK